MPHVRTITAIQAPSGANLTPVLPYLERVGAVEFRFPSVAYVDLGADAHAKRLHKRVLLIRATTQALLNIQIRMGVGSSKLVSLIAARQSGPGGITTVPAGTEETFLNRVVIDLLPGIGRRTASYLRNRGVTTIGKFGQLPQTVAVRLFGISGIILREFSRGSDPRDILPASSQRQKPITGRRSLLTLFGTANSPSAP